MRRCRSAGRLTVGGLPYGGMSGHSSGSAQCGRFDAPDAVAAIGRGVAGGEGARRRPAVQGVLPMDVSAKIAIAKPAAVAWRVVGEDFANISRWIVGITSSSTNAPPAVGVVRTCELQSVGPIAPRTVQERLTLYNPNAMELEYRAIEGLPPVFTQAMNRWSVEAVDTTHCVVTMHATIRLRSIFRLIEPLLKWWIVRSGGLEELRHYVEQGRPHPRKQRFLSVVCSSPWQKPRCIRSALHPG